MALIIDNSVEALTKLSKALKDQEAINKFMSNAVADEVVDLFISISNTQKENKFGKGHTFWKRMIKSVRAVFSETSSIVEMNRAIALKYFGGPVRPTGGRKALTIPVSKEAYNKSARSFPNLFVFRYAGDGDNGKAYLAMQKGKDEGIGPGKKNKLVLMYLLLPFTKHNPDRSVLPTRQRIERVRTNAINEYLKRKTQ
jgi:hypothetical protein